MTYKSSVLADTPAVYCRLDDASGNFTDSSGNARNATANGSPTYHQPPAALIDGNSITWAGLNIWGDLGTTTYFDSLTALTVEAWFKTTDTSSNLNIVARDNSAGSTFRGWRLRMVTGQINCIVFGNVSTTSANITSPLSYNDGNWHHAVLTATNNGNVFLYIDGTQVATAAMAFTMAVSNIVGEHTFIGAAHSGGSWTGSLDEVAIYTSALSAARVLAHYNAALVPQSELLRDARLSTQVLSYTAASRARTGRLSTQVLIGPPQKMRVGRLSVRVLSKEPAAPPAAPRFEGWGIPI